MFTKWLKWMNDGELIPLYIAIPSLIAAFFIPMMLIAGLDAPLWWLQSVVNAIAGVK